MEKDININCSCGCGNGFLISFRFLLDNDGDILIDTITSGFSAHQCGFIKRLARRIKAAWFMLRGKEFYLHEIALNKEQWNGFVDAVDAVGKLE